MSTHYLVDPFSAAREIIDVTWSEEGTTDSTGALLIRVPDGTAIEGAPKDLGSLLSAKADGLLAYYAGFGTIRFDPCLANTGVSTGSSAGVTIGAGLANHCILPGGTLVTGTLNLGGVAPTVCVVVWEAYSFLNVDPSTGRFTRTYVEEDSDLLGCQVTFNNHTSRHTVTSGAVLNLPGSGQGTALALVFTNNTGSRLYLGGWAVIY